MNALYYVVTKRVQAGEGPTAEAFAVTLHPNQFIKDGWELNTHARGHNSEGEALMELGFRMAINQACANTLDKCYR